MKYFCYLSLLLLLFTACSSSKNASGQARDVNPSNTDGTSVKTAILINETSETTGVDAEYNWLKKYYPGYTFEGQSLDFSKDGHPYDILHIKTAEGQKKDIYFDIIKYYGHF